MATNLCRIIPELSFSPDVLEFISMSALKNKVEAWRLRFPGMAWLFAELELVEIFSHIDRLSLPVALVFFLDFLCNSKGLCPHSTRFSIHKGGVKTFDHVACNGSNWSQAEFHRRVRQGETTQQ